MKRARKTRITRVACSRIRQNRCAYSGSYAQCVSSSLNRIGAATSTGTGQIATGNPTPSSAAITAP